MAADPHPGVKEPPTLPPCPDGVHDEVVEADVQRDHAEPASVEERLERVYRENAERLWRAVLLAFGSREVADDAVAEAFAQALRRAS